MHKLAVGTFAIGAALITGALVQVYYSDLPPLSPWSEPAVYSFLATMLVILASAVFSRRR